jgi:hypothetical protein
MMSKACPLLAFLAIVISAAYRDAINLMKYPVAVGVDGYYYAPQASEVLHSGHLYFFTYTPFAIYFIAGLTHFIGNPVLATKVAAIFFKALLCAGVFALIVNVGCSRWLGALGALLTAFAGLHFHLIAEFINNLAGASIMVAAGAVRR